MTGVLDQSRPQRRLDHGPRLQVYVLQGLGSIDRLHHRHRDPHGTQFADEPGEEVHR